MSPTRRVRDDAEARLADAQAAVVILLDIILNRHA